MPPFLLSMLLDWRVWAGLALVFAAWWLRHDGVMSERHKWEAATAEQKREAAALLANEITKNDLKAAEYAALLTQWQNYARKADDDYAKQIESIRAARNNAGGVRLFDPGRGARCSGAAPARAADAAGAAVAENPATDRPELSADATGFLLDQATLADQVTAYAWACHRFVMTLPQN